VKNVTSETFWDKTEGFFMSLLTYLTLSAFPFNVHLKINYIKNEFFYGAAQSHTVLRDFRNQFMDFRNITNMNQI
jgi:hypothetical protein